MQPTETSAWGWDTTRLFLASGVDVRNWDGYYGTALQAASARGHEGVVEYLLEHGATINGSGHHGTALQAAAHEGQERVVRLLVQRGADVNQRGRHGTALHATTKRSMSSIFVVLFVYKRLHYMRRRRRDTSRSLDGSLNRGPTSTRRTTTPRHRWI
jgi:ankyrin repeat protein